MNRNRINHLHHEILEQRCLLTVSMMEFSAIQDTFPEFQLPADMSDMNIIEVETHVVSTDSAGLKLEECTTNSLRQALTLAESSSIPTLVIIRTPENVSSAEIVISGNKGQADVSTDRYMYSSVPDPGILTIVALRNNGSPDIQLKITIPDESPVLTRVNGLCQLGNLQFSGMLGGDDAGIQITGGSLMLKNVTMLGNTAHAGLFYDGFHYSSQMQDMTVGVRFTETLETSDEGNIQQLQGVITGIIRPVTDSVPDYMEQYDIDEKNLPESTPVDEWNPFWYEVWVTVDTEKISGNEWSLESILFNLDLEAGGVTPVLEDGEIQMECGAAFHDITFYDSDTDELLVEPSVQATVKDDGTIKFSACVSLFYEDTENSEKPYNVGVENRYALVARILCRANVSIAYNQFQDISVIQQAETEDGYPACAILVVDDSTDNLTICELPNYIFTPSNPFNSEAPSVISGTCYAVPYDLDDNGRIELSDLSKFAQNYGKTVTDSSNATMKTCDFNADGKVNLADLSLFALNYGKKANTSVYIDYPDKYIPVSERDYE